MHERVELNPGLALIRYVSDAPGDYNAEIEVEIPAGVSAVFDPTCRGPVLERPGQCVVVRCDAATEVRLWPQPSVRGEQVRGSVTVEYLAKGRPSARGQMQQRPDATDLRRPQPPVQDHARQPLQADRSPAPQEGLRLLGHLAYVGDKIATGGQWLGGPDAPARIEGVTVSWPQCPAGVELLLCDPATGQTCRTGEFLGSKGQSRTLRGLEAWLEGHVPEGLSLTAEAVFERAGVVRKQGKWIALMGMDATDELIGLKLEISPGAENSDRIGSANVSAAIQQNNDPDPNSVRFASEVSPTTRQRTRLFRKKEF